MKNSFFGLILFFLSVFSVSAQNLLYISGYVRDINTQPLANHDVLIHSDSASGTVFFYYNTVQTDADGYYADSIPLTNLSTSGVMNVTVTDCNSQSFTQYLQYGPNAMNLAANFYICSGNPTSCQAAFTYALSPNGTTTYQFTDTSSGNPQNWYWNFGDGYTSTLQNPVHTFDSTGYYTVCLSISSNDSSCYDTTCQTIAINTPPAGCQAYFSYNFDSTAVNPMQLSFFDQSQGNPNTWSWSFGDGSSSTQQNPVHIYTAAGQYSVCLTITGDSICNDTYCKTVIVGNNPPGCQAYYTFSSDSTAAALIYQFQDLSTGNPQNWSWSFGDGQTSAMQNPLHTYAQPGIYNVCLTIGNANTACYDTFCAEINVGNVITGCESSFTYTVSGLAAGFSAYMLNGQSAQFTWNTGDGLTLTGTNITHTYSTAGTYTVTLNSVDNSGCQFTSSQTIFVGDSINIQNLWGNVWAGNLPLTNGMAMLYGINSTAVTNSWFDNSGFTANGTYHFDSVPDCSYRIQAIPFSVNGDSGAWLPTYYGNVLFWQQATGIVLGTANNPYNIQLIAAPGLLAGNGNIGGIVNGGLKSSTYDKVNIFIMNDANEVLAFRRLNENGNYNFGDIAFGSYKIWAEMNGMNTQAIPVVISENNPNAIINMSINSNTISGIGQSAVSQPVVKIYPSPAREILTIELSSATDFVQEIRIYGMSGNILIEKAITSKDLQFSLNIHHLSPGIYILRLQTSGGSVSNHRFIKF